MTRINHINHALESYPNKYDNGAPESVTAYNEGYDDGFETGFVEGASWADANPYCWHKCSEELPEPNVPVLAVAKAHKEYYLYVGYYDDDDECWRADINDEEILVDTVYWAELPNPPLNSIDYGYIRNHWQRKKRSNRPLVSALDAVFTIVNAVES